MDGAENADLVVVGGGAAALSAALEARRRGLDVLLVCKRRAGSSGNSIVAAANFSVLRTGEEDGAFTDDLHLGGRGICDPPLVARFADESRSAVEFLESAGVLFSRRNGRRAWKHIPGHSVPRTVGTQRDGFPMSTAGLSITRPLRAAAEAAGVRVLDQTPVLELLVDRDRVCGVVAAPSGTTVPIRTGRVILATGGYAGLYAHSSNTGDTTADGLALACRAGASLRDLEFVQFHPTRALRPIRGILPTTLFDDGAVLRNRLGDRFLQEATGLEDRDVPRDQMSRALVRELAEGRGCRGAVLLDLSRVPNTVGRSQYQRVWQALRRHGCDPARDPVEVGVAAHFSMGGVWIDEDCATGVAGLYAAGEVAGGIHGANRLGGTALSEAVTMGRVAARHAADIEPAPCTPLFPARPVARAGDPAAGRRVRQELGNILWQCAGVTRSAEGLREGLRRIDRLAERTATECRKDGTWTDPEATSALTIARLVVQAAEQREESRGAHWRADFPETQEAWRGSLRVKQAPGSDPQFTFIPAMV